MGLKQYHCTDILPSMMMSVTCVVLFFTTIFKVKGTIFGFKDYDMVMSLPISTSGVIISRLIILYSINAIFVIIFMVPMMLAYAILMVPSPLFYLYGIVALLFIPLIPIVVSSVIGTIVAYIATRFRHNNLLTILLTMGLLGAIIGFPFTLVNQKEQQLVDMSKAVSAQVNTLYPLAGLYTKAVVEYDVIALLTFILISMIAFLIYTILVKAVFIKLNTAIMTGSYRKKFVLGKVKTSSPLHAFFNKELKRYLSSSNYVINTAFAVVMFTMGTVALFFVDLNPLINAGLPAGAVTYAVPVFLFFCVGLCCTTMSAISLEGKSLWIMKSLPVEPKTIYKAKIAVNLLVLSPCLIDAFLLGLALKMSIWQSLVLVFMAAACGVGISLYGILVNLRFPNFNWSNELIIIKQSTACMITVFSSMLLSFAPILLMLLVPSVTFAYVIITLLTAVFDAVLYMILINYGNKRFAQLGG
jgi:ABC-2 type transport system permease protein